MNKLFSAVSKLLRGETVSVEQRQATSTSISVNRVNDQTTFVVNGVTYTDIADIPEPEQTQAREALARLDRQT